MHFLIMEATRLGLPPQQHSLTSTAGTSAVVSVVNIIREHFLKVLIIGSTGFNRP